MTAPPARRPGLVTLIIVLVVIGGVLSVLAGVLLVLLRNNAELNAQIDGQGLAGTSALWVGIVTIVVGLIYLLVARGLARGSNSARTIVAIVTVLNMATSLYIIFTHVGEARSSAIGSAIVGALVLIILYTPSANAFYGTR